MLKNELQVLEGNSLLIDIRGEVKGLQETWNKIKEIKDNYDSATLARDIRALQDASRIQKLTPGARDVLLALLQQRKILKQIVDGEGI